jgi:hypothetical protein
MKKNLLFLLLINVIISAQAQITLTQANMAPAVGDVYTSYTADTSIQAGPAGANQTWTFNGLNITSTVVTQNFVTPSSTPCSASYPSANVTNQIGTQYEYLNVSSSSIILKGVCSGSSTVIMTNTYTYYQFPLTYNTNVNNPSITGTFNQGTLSGHSTTLGDGYGTLVINGITFNNVLRVKLSQYLDYNYTSVGQHLISDGVSYYWFDGVHKNPLLYISASDISGFTSGHVKTVYVSDFAVGINELTSSSLEVNAYPNPAHNVVNLNLGDRLSGEVVLSLFSSSGQLVLSKNIDGVPMSSIPIELGNLSTGIYMLRLDADKKHASTKIVIE